MSAFRVEDLLGPFRELKDVLGRLDVRDLPSVPVDDVHFAGNLPLVPAVYFLETPSLGLLYIGRATNLRSRWAARFRWDGSGRIDWEHSHAKLADALAVGDARLAWLAVPREYLAFTESLLLQIHTPPWNQARG
jgi:excinuclease UvrABC nuclease subunit